MENKQIALSDVERNKELFEYEMTEVILQLKGEFANLSGKDMNFDDTQLDIPDVNFNADIPSVKIDKISLGTQETADVSGSKTVIPDVKIEKTSVDCPTVPAMGGVSLADVKIESTKLDCPAVNAQVNAKLEPVNISSPAISAVKADISIPAVGDAAVSVNGMGVQSPDAVKPAKYTPKEVDVNMASVEVSDVAMGLKINTDAVNVENVSVDCPDVAKVNIPEFGAVTTETEKLDIPAVGPVGLKNSGVEVTVEKTKVDYEYSAVDNIEMPEVVIRRINSMEVPHLPDFSETIKEIIESAV